MVNRKVTAEEIDAAKTAKGGWDRATLAAWGVGWPPPKGWRQMLIDGVDFPEPRVGGEPATAVRPTDCLEARMLRALVIAIIEADRGDLLARVDGLATYFGSGFPTVQDVVGELLPPNIVIEGGLRLDDRVYKFSCIRTVTKEAENR